MSYEIVYDKRFIKTTRGIIPLVLIGSNNCFTTLVANNGKRYDKCSRSWSLILGHRKIECSEADLITQAESYVPSNYNQHFKYNGKWVDDNGWLNFVKSGIKNASTIEEIIEKYRTYALNLSFYSYFKPKNAALGTFYRSATTTAQLEDTLDEMYSLIEDEIENDTALPFAISFSDDDRLELRRKTYRGYKEVPDTFYCILIDGSYFKKLSSRHLFRTHDICGARLFETPAAAKKYYDNSISKKYNLKNPVIQGVQYVIATDEKPSPRYWTGAGFTNDFAYAMHHKTKISANSALIKLPTGGPVLSVKLQSGKVQDLCYTLQLSGT